MRHGPELQESYHGIPDGEQRGTENILREVITGNVPNLVSESQTYRFKKLGEPQGGKT